MTVTIYMRDILLEAVSRVKERYAGYKITKIQEIRGKKHESLQGFGGWSGLYSELDCTWVFSLEKQSLDWKGASKLEIDISPVTEIAFADDYLAGVFFDVYVMFPEQRYNDKLPVLIQGVEQADDFWDICFQYDSADIES